MVGQLGIRTPSIDQLVKNLSGGNQQKTILARWMGSDVKVILLDEPTRGIDVGAKSEIYEVIRTLGERGIGVLLYSSELDELCSLCDRVLVLFRGQLVASLGKGELTRARLLSTMMGKPT